MNVFEILIQQKYRKQYPVLNMAQNEIYTTIHFTPIMDKLERNLSKNLATIFMSSFYSDKSKLNVIEKYKLVRKTFSNPFADKEAKEEYIKQLCDIQKKYFTLLKFIRLCFLKRAKVQINTDLYMNTLDITHKNTYMLFQCGRIYYFAITDLLKIIYNSITHSPHLFLLPVRAKNPYTNIELSKSDLYNIYYKAKSSLLCIPQYLELYFRCDFNIYELRRRYETELYHLVLVNHIQNSRKEVVYSTFLEMLMRLKLHKVIDVNEDYPRDQLLKEMKPYILLYLKYKYICDKQLKYNYKCELKYKLLKFLKYNSFYGRKINKPKPNGCIFEKSSPSYHFIGLHVIPKRNNVHFMNNHIYHDNTYNLYSRYGEYDDKEVDLKYTQYIDTDDNLDSEEEEGVYYSPQISQTQEPTTTLLPSNGVSANINWNINNTDNTLPSFIMEDINNAGDNTLNEAPELHTVNRTQYLNERRLRQRIIMVDDDYSSDEESVYENPQDNENETVIGSDSDDTDSEEEKEEDYDW